MKSDEANVEITTAMIAALERGLVPWHCPWTLGPPSSMWSGKPYRGINVLILALTAAVKGYTSPYWGTFERLAETAGCVKTPRAGGKGFYWKSPDGQPRGVKKDEKSTVVYFWEHKVKPDPDDPDNRDSDIHYTFTTYKRVFNLEQAAFPDGIPEKYVLERDIGQLPDAEKVLTEYVQRAGVSLVLGAKAAYNPGPDELILPPRRTFDSVEEYYSTAFHEGVHSTGHPMRLRRPGVYNFDHFGTERYAKEELVAEMGAAMLCAMLGIEGVFDNSAAYITGWLTKFKSDPALIRTAAKEAQKAVDLIMDDHPYGEE